MRKLASLLSIAAVLWAAPARARQAGPVNAPVHAAEPDAVDWAHVRGSILIEPDESWRVSILATGVLTGGDSRVIRLRADGLAIDTAYVVIPAPPDSAAAAAPDSMQAAVPDSMRVVPPDSEDVGTPDAARTPVGVTPDTAMVHDPTRLPIPAGFATGDTVHVAIRYRVLPGTALRSSSSGGPCCTWTWSERTGGASWLPFETDPPDRFTAELAFAGAPVVTGGRRTVVGDTVTVRVPVPVSARHLPVVTGRLARVRTADRFVYYVPEGLADRLRGFSSLFEAAWEHMERLTGYVPPLDTVRVAFVDIDRTAEEAGWGLVLASTDHLVTRRARVSRNTAYEAGRLASRFWAGTVVEPSSWADDWLYEALTAAMAVDFTRTYRGEGAAWRALAGLEDAYLAEAGRYRRPLVWDRWDRPSDLVDAHATGRGTWFLRLLRGEVGEAGFASGLIRFFAANALGESDTETFRTAVERASGTRLQGLFDTWVYGAGHPEISMASGFDARGEVLTVTLRQTQAGPLVPDVFPIESELVWRTLSGDGSRSVAISGRATDVRIDLPIEPRYVVLDPNGSILARIQSDRDVSEATAVLRYAPIAARYRAAVSLRGLATDPALPLALRLALEQEGEPVVRRAILATAGALPPSSSLESLLRRGYSDGDARVRGEAIRLAAAFRSDAAELAEFVADAAANDSATVVQAAAVETLAAMGGADADYVARAALITPSDGEVIRRAGFRALARLDSTGRDLRAEVLLHTDPDLPPDHILAALSVAGQIEADAALERRVRVLLAHPHYRVREAAAREAGGLVDRSVLEERLEVEPDRGVRDALERALVRVSGTD